VDIEQQVKEIFNKVLDIKPEEIQLDAKLSESLDIDSTELVEISVAIKKEFNVPLGDGELKKDHTFSQIIEIISSKQVA